MLPMMRRSSNRLVDPLDVVENEFNRVLRHLWTDGGEADNLTGAYPCDIREDDEHVYVDAEMPGFRKEDVQVTLESGILHILAERKDEPAKGQPHLQERRFTRVARSFTMPTVVDENKVDARIDNGVLHLVFTKREEVRPRKIEVK